MDLNWTRKARPKKPILLVGNLRPWPSVGFPEERRYRSWGMVRVLWTCSGKLGMLDLSSSYLELTPMRYLLWAEETAEDNNFGPL